MGEKKEKQKRLTLRRAVSRANPPAGERTGKFWNFRNCRQDKERKSWEMHKSDRTARKKILGAQKTP